MLSYSASVIVFSLCVCFCALLRHILPFYFRKKYETHTLLRDVDITNTNISVNASSFETLSYYYIMPRCVCVMYLRVYEFQHPSRWKEQQLSNTKLFSSRVCIILEPYVFDSYICIFVCARVCVVVCLCMCACVFAEVI